MPEAFTLDYQLLTETAESLTHIRVSRDSRQGGIECFLKPFKSHSRTLFVGSNKQSSPLERALGSQQETFAAQLVETLIQWGE